MTLTQERLKSVLNYNPVTGEFVRLKNGEVAGGVHSTGYRHIKVDGKVYKAHRLAFLFMTGEIPVQVDHINRVKDDNRWNNLRPATQQENNYNCSNRQGTVSGLRNINWHAGTQSWMVRVRDKKISRYLGLFKDLELAEFVASEARAKYHGEFATA